MLPMRKEPIGRYIFTKLGDIPAIAEWTSEHRISAEHPKSLEQQRYISRLRFHGD